MKKIKSQLLCSLPMNIHGMVSWAKNMVILPKLEQKYDNGVIFDANCAIAVSRFRSWTQNG